MKTKRKTPAQSIQDMVQLTLKRKWQIALRRYILEGNPSVQYAPYFGLPAYLLKKWIELHFKENMNWENFGKVWSLTQKVPAHLFNLSDEKDIALCWNFINISIQELKEKASVASVDLFSTKAFFQQMLDHTGFQKCREMLDKIEALESAQAEQVEPLANFIQENQLTLVSLLSFDKEDFARVNRGEEVEAILMEKEIIKKYGS